ncbi:hypothetical protein [Vibrio chagasii]|uniref:hypothetical protein n=1 Tax=Vibrio chagasii TaxID=170679 RepID=UPI003DA16DF0
MNKLKRLEENNALVVTAASNSKMKIDDYMEQQAEKNFPMLDPLGQEIAIEWAHNPVANRVAKEFGLGTSSLLKILKLPLVAAAVRHYRSEITEDVILDKKAIRAERWDLYLMAKGEKDIQKIDKDGMQVEGKETNLPAAERLLSSIEKADGQLIDDNLNNSGLVMVFSKDHIRSNQGALPKREPVTIDQVEGQ